MKKIAIVLLSGILYVSCTQSKTDKVISNKESHEMCTDSVRDGVFIHITESYNDAHRVLMPLKMAVLMSDSKDVLVYMDIHAVELLVKGAEDLNYADFESVQTYLKILKEKNVGVYACPTCLKIAGFKPDDLIEGIQVAQKDKFFNFTKGRIITLDY
jgi:predicted peroxiredoxin